MEFIKENNNGQSRVCTSFKKSQNLDYQIDALQDYGCERIFSEKVSGKKSKKTELDRCLDYLRSEDTLVVYKLDRLGRTTKQLIELAQWFENHDIELEIIEMNINTNDAMGKMFFTMMSAFAELEANLLSERIKKGLSAARAQGKIGGRPRLPDHKRSQIKFLYNEQKLTGQEIAEQTGVSRTTVYRVIKEE